MKAMILTALMIGLLGTHADTVRVKNQTVDLAPVVEWMRTKEGDRPMAHWKVVQIESMVGRAWGGHRVMARLDEEPIREIVVQNIPISLAQRLEHDRFILNAMAEVETRIEEVELFNQQLNRELDLAIRAGDFAYELNRTQRLANNQAIVQLRLTHDRLAATLQMTEELEKARLLAYFTGQKVGEVEVWDCGLGANLYSFDPDQPKHVEPAPLTIPGG
jgi:hypothetical protein